MDERTPTPIPTIPPDYITPEHTGSWRDRIEERLAGLASEIASTQAELQEYKAHTPSTEWVRHEVTGLRQSIEAQIVALPSKELLQKEIEMLKEAVTRVQPPSFWKLVSLVAGAVLAIGGVVWRVGAGVSEVAVQSALTQERIGDLRVRLERLDAAERADAAKVDQILLQMQSKQP
jgi:hypothetical protein